MNKIRMSLFGCLALVVFYNGMKAMEEQLCEMTISNDFSWTIMINGVKLKSGETFKQELKNGESLNVYVPDSKKEYVLYATARLKIKNESKKSIYSTSTYMFLEAGHKERCANLLGVSLYIKKAERRAESHFVKD